MKTRKNKAFFAICAGLAVSLMGMNAHAQESVSDFSSVRKLLNHNQLFSTYRGEKITIQSMQSGVCLSAWWRNTACVAHPESQWLVRRTPSAAFVQFYNPLTGLCLGMAQHHSFMLGGVSCASPFARWQVIGESGKTFEQSRVLLTYYRGMCASDVPSRTAAFAMVCTSLPHQVYRMQRAN